MVLKRTSQSVLCKYGATSVKADNIKYDLLVSRSSAAGYARISRDEKILAEENRPVTAKLELRRKFPWT